MIADHLGEVADPICSGEHLRNIRHVLRIWNLLVEFEIVAYQEFAVVCLGSDHAEDAVEHLLDVPVSLFDDDPFVGLVPQEGFRIHFQSRMLELVFPPKAYNLRLGLLELVQDSLEAPGREAVVAVEIGDIGRRCKGETVIPWTGRGFGIVVQHRRAHVAESLEHLWYFC